MVERVTYGSFSIGEPLDRRVRVENTRSDRQVFEDEVFAGRHDARRAVAIDVDYGFVGLASKLQCHINQDVSRKGAKAQRRRFSLCVFLCAFAPLRETSFLFISNLVSANRGAAPFVA